MTGDASAGHSRHFGMELMGKNARLVNLGKHVNFDNLRRILRRMVNRNPPLPGKAGKDLQARHLIGRHFAGVAFRTVQGLPGMMAGVSRLAVHSAENHQQDNQRISYSSHLTVPRIAYLVSGE